MVLDKIEILVDKYFQGETSIVEETELRNYFSSSNVPQHLERYKPMFDYFSQVKEQKFTPEMPLQSKKRNVAWLSIAASIIVLLGIGTFTYSSYDKVSENKALGTYDDPEIAFRETQKALALLSNHVNVGIEGVRYIQEYENTRDKVFIVD
jgi:hypothetical protein